MGTHSLPPSGGSFLLGRWVVRVTALGQDDILSDTTTLKWLEKILIPVLVAGFISLSTCAVRSNESITKLEGSSAEELKARGKTEQALNSLSKQQTELQIQLNTVRTHQEYIIDDIEQLKSELKEQNNSILEAIKNIK